MRLGDLPPNFATYICSHLAAGERSVERVWLELDGDLWMCCGEEDDDFTDGEAWKIVGLKHLLASDPSIPTLLDLPAGFQLSREAKVWTVSPLIFRST
ncbi:hypothetical protein [Stagnihabitans tardus]|uniref:DUF2185 domain-containing protein n=1 Tax=Stagnihabitans tardus TaxID=2699202 RepID=A0AAE4Y6R9_9RHOB|nr:hypothetical protein [Stagnihabitans tardus]NBZ86162.1 hypothetical protein [Stagnihabitans tardus]